MGHAFTTTRTRDNKMTGDEWCSKFKHTFKKVGGEETCISCWKSKAEIEKAEAANVPAKT